MNAKREPRVGNKSNPYTRGVEAPLVRRASATRMGLRMAAFLENFLGTGED